MSISRLAGAKVLTLPFHVGGPIVIITAYLIALKNNYQYLVKIDGDGQHRPEDALKILRVLTRNEADVVIGSRYLPGGHDPERSLFKNMGKAFSSTIIDFIIKEVRITDATSGLRAWNRKALIVLTKHYLSENTIIPEDSVFWPYETIIAYKKGLRIKEIPIEVLPRMHGKSKSYTSVRMMKFLID